MSSVLSALFLFAPFDLSMVPTELQGWWIGVLSFGAGIALTAVVLRRALIGRDTYASEGPVVPSLKTQMPALHAEVDRARRYERSVAVVVMKLDDARTVGASLGLVDPGSGGGIVSEQARSLVQSARQVMFWNVGYVLNDLLRENDVAACDLSEQRYVVLLPEAEEEEAVQAAQRLEKRIMDAAGVHVRQGVAVYRLHGLTVDHLMESASSMSERMAKSPVGKRASERRASKIHRIPDRRSSL